ncbi:MAG: GGDEF domain-containing protein, partial [Spirochaetaceae bacterium]|nr:GGDEF domain-containing protein [Spirochaetaceae bacterium]
AQIEKIINDTINQKMLNYSHAKNENIAMAHVLTDRYYESVITELKLEDKEPFFHRLFLSINKQNAFIILFHNQEDKKDYQHGRIYYAMRDGNILEDQIHREIDLEKELLPQELLPRGYSSMVVQILFVHTDLLGYIIYDYKRDQAELNEFLSRSISGTIKSLETSFTLNENNKRLEEEIILRIQSENTIKELLKDLKNLSTKDQLTGLINRRGFFTVGEQQIKQYIRNKENFMVMYCDMDNLKGINDKYGHNEGDAALCAMAEILKKSLRDSDIIARLGGDEFTVLLGAAEPSNLKEIDARLQKNIQQSNQTLNKPYKIDFSYGFCSSKDSDSHELFKMMEAADNQLYNVKKKKKKWNQLQKR